MIHPLLSLYKLLIAFSIFFLQIIELSFVRMGEPLYLKPETEPEPEPQTGIYDLIRLSISKY